MKSLLFLTLVATLLAGCSTHRTVVYREPVHTRTVVTEPAGTTVEVVRPATTYYAPGVRYYDSYGPHKLGEYHQSRVYRVPYIAVCQHEVSTEAISARGEPSFQVKPDCGHASFRQNAHVHLVRLKCNA